MAAATLRQTKVTVLLSINAAAIFLAGVLIAGSIWLKDGLDFKVVGERSDEINEQIEQAELISSESNSATSLTDSQKSYITSVHARTGVDSTPVPEGELWGENSINIYETADFDICAGGELGDLGEMYWQTSNTDVISGFYNSARTWLGYSSDTCRYPIIVGTGKTTITAGTYDGSRRDTIEVNVIELPKTRWAYEVLSLVNQERIRNGLEKLSWGDTCSEAAEIRANELVELYSHTRPDGRPWHTACDSPNNSSVYTEGENLAVGSSAVSPETTVATWMNSETHRENILNPNFTKLSVGIFYDSDTKYKTHWSQYFSNF